jgi:hypothetical protein
VQIVFYFLYGNLQVAFCFFLSCFYTKSRTAAITAYLWVFMSAIFAQQLLQTIVQRSRWFTPVIELIPTFAVFRCASSHILCVVGGGAHAPGVTWAVKTDVHIIKPTTCVPLSDQPK